MDWTDSRIYDPRECTTIFGDDGRMNSNECINYNNKKKKLTQ